jgi:hypothetical protein
VSIWWNRESRQTKETAMNDAARSAHARNLVVFADGTGQDGGLADNTNIYRMFWMAEDRTARSEPS